MRVPLAAPAALLMLAIPPLASATLLPGAGSPRTECYVQLDLDSFAPSETRQRAFCVDGDPTCDHDGLCNGSCTFRARICINDLGIRQCTPPPALKRLTVRQSLLPLPDSLSATGCGDFADLTVPVRGPVIRPRPGKLVLHVTATAGRSDRDRFVLVCGPRFDDCPPQPTTTTAPATTTTSTTVFPTTSTTGGTSTSTTTTTSTTTSTTATTSSTTTSSTTTSSTSTTGESTTTTSSTSTTEESTTTTSSTSTTEESTTTTSSTSTTEEPTTTLESTTTTSSLPASPSAAFVAQRASDRGPDTVGVALTRNLHGLSASAPA